jgi:hypothetical protein
MPYIEGGSLRERLERETQLAVDGGALVFGTITGKTTIGSSR